ncbi:MAG: serine protease, partial [Planctomycetes bacterium]|nr:serine protease [Planctomycetota bacterium]
MISRIVSSIVVMVAIALAGTASLLAQSAPNPKVDSLKDMEELEKHVQEIIAKARPAVVGIFAGGGGSGTLISEDGWIATAAHVTGVTAGAPVQIVLADGTSMPGTVRGTHMAMDYALIKVEPKEGQKFPYVELGDSGALVKGQWVLAMGHPLGTEGGRGPVVRLGRVINPRMIPSTFVHVDAPLISGDSGGPIFDLGGNLVAINQSIGTQDVRQNMTTPVNGMKEILDQLKDDQALGRAQNYGVGGGVQSEMSPEDMEDYQA